MDTKPLPNHLNDNTNAVQSPYYFIGRDAAQASGMVLNTIASGLDKAYGEFIKNEKNLNAQRIDQWENDIRQLEDKQADAEADLDALHPKKQNEIENISEWEAQLLKVKNEGEQADTLPFILGSIIVILVTLYLILFYMATGYQAFLAKKVDSIGIPDFSSLENSQKATIVLFPMIFLAIGFAVYISLKNKKIIQLIGLLAFTFLFDLILAYQISKKVITFNWQYKGGSKFTSMEPFTSVDFYLILASGFVVYIIWGFLLDWVLKESYRTRPDQMKAAAVGRLRIQINGSKAAIVGYDKDIATSNRDIERLIEQIDAAKKQISILIGGGVIVSLPALNGMVASFRQGWSAYLSLFGTNSHTQIDDSSVIADEWLRKKTQYLQSSPDGTTLVAN